ncbi:MAG: hypothetical protein KAI84_19025 [Gammaproteobacteria bacterium]|nr:hypothetical protein [Gammaproteobacteria bacterium]
MGNSNNNEIAVSELKNIYFSVLPRNDGGIFDFDFIPSLSRGGFREG